MSEKINVKELKNLFEKIKNNNNTAFEELYSKYSKLIYKIAYSILKNKSDADCRRQKLPVAVCFQFKERR